MNLKYKMLLIFSVHFLAVSCVTVTDKKQTTFEDLKNRAIKEVAVNVESSAIDSIRINIDEELSNVKVIKSSEDKVVASVYIFDKNKPFDLSETTVLNSFEIDYEQRAAIFDSSVSAIRHCTKVEMMRGLFGSLSSTTVYLGKAPKKETRDENICISAIVVHKSLSSNVQVFHQGEEVLAAE